jgi:hypothetical protein
MLNYLKSFLLHHNGDCRFLGVTPTLSIYVEEIFGDDDQLAQHVLASDGHLLHSVDESRNAASDFVPLYLPPDIVRPISVRYAQRLNYSGPRQRGMRDQERIVDVARALEVPTRIWLAQQTGLSMPMIMGVAESRVLAEALLTPPDTYLVCRRLRIAYALKKPQRDADQQWYDYDTLAIYAAHLYNATAHEVDLPPDDVFAGLPGVQLHRPMDCLACHQHLFVADGGDETRPSQVHIWRITE